MPKETIQESINQAIKFQQCGDLAKAELLYNSILAKEPQNPDVNHLLGVLHHLTGRTNTAVALITQAINLCPSNPYYYNNLGSLLKSDGKFKKAEHCFQKALSLNPDYPEALYNMAGMHHMSDNYDLALTLYKKAVEEKPLFPQAYSNMAATLNILERYDEALACCKKAEEIKPNYSEAKNNMGNAYQALGKLELAISCYQTSMALSGESAEVLCNYANALQEKGEIDEAIVIYGKAIKLKPEYGKAYNNLGTALRCKRKLKDAEAQFMKAIRLVPNDREAYHNMGNVCYDNGNFESASLWYDKAIAIDPRSIQSHINRGILYQESDESDNALKCFNKGLALDPKNSKAQSHMVHELYQRCEWLQIDDLNANIDTFTERELAMGQRPNEMPFLSLIRNANPLINYRVAQRWSREISKNTIGKKWPLTYRHTHTNQKKITIGYLSNNFRDHPTSHLINGIFDLHDRTGFAINAYSYGEDDSSLYRENIKQKCDTFTDLHNVTHEDAAQHIFNDQVDILVDLVGYMRGNRLEICAYRPAPVQVRWLGLAGTTGANFFDYIITDSIVTPESQELFYSEKFVYLPDTYQVNSKPLIESEKNFLRNGLGLPEGGFVYCCFCSSYKIEPAIFRIWMDILKRVPNSVLWLLKGNDIVEKNLRSEASKYGIFPERIVFADKMGKADHLERLKLAGIALDTIAVNGAATTSDALWAGVPVITMKGAHFASRMSASILNAVGLTDLVLEDEDAYLKVAVEIGNNPKFVQEIKERLKVNRLEKPLFDTQGFVKNLEKAYSKMWAFHSNGMKPKFLHVKDT